MVPKVKFDLADQLRKNVSSKMEMVNKTTQWKWNVVQSSWRIQDMSHHHEKYIGMSYHHKNTDTSHRHEKYIDISYHHEKYKTCHAIIRNTKTCHFGYHIYNTTCGKIKYIYYWKNWIFIWSLLISMLYTWSYFFESNFKWLV